LSEQIREVFEACKQQPPDLARKEMCRSQLQQDINRIYAAGRLYLTGSSMNGLGCRSSDADLCLVIRGNVSTAASRAHSSVEARSLNHLFLFQRKHNPVDILSVLQRFFKSLLYVEKTQLIRATVPILRFREKGSNLEFDLNVNNTVGIRNTFLLRGYANADHRIKPMILVVKKWARHNQINDASKGTLSSYTLVLMVLHYLQTLQEPVVPSLQLDYPKDPNASHRMSPGTSRLWESCCSAFSSTMPHISDGINISSLSARPKLCRRLILSTGKTNTFALKSHLKEITLPELSTRGPSLRPLEPSLQSHFTSSNGGGI
ncbi:unnamed protein product, partial [Tetraodon nigroviridis]